MAHKIFLSHNSKDKPVVEPVAMRLRAIFGESEVFYDSWSIKPGQGIIEQMNKGLEAPEYVFFFVSANSLNSEMVKLEWQNALFAATKGKTRIIPIRVDGAAMPPILSQNLYIDMHTVGLEAAISQIVGVAQGNSSFTPQHQGFSNLTFTMTTDAAGTIDVVIRASHLMEPNPFFLLLVENPESELSWEVPGSSGFFGGFNTGLKLDGGGPILNGAAMKPMGAVLSPAYPVRLRLKPKGAATIIFRGVMHQVSEEQWRAVPPAPQSGGFLSVTI